MRALALLQAAQRASEAVDVRAEAGCNSGLAALVATEITAGASVLARVQQHPDLLSRLACEDTNKRCTASRARVVLLRLRTLYRACADQGQRVVRLDSRWLPVELGAWSARLDPEVHFCSRLPIRGCGSSSFAGSPPRFWVKGGKCQISHSQQTYQEDVVLPDNRRRAPHLRYETS